MTTRCDDDIEDAPPTQHNSGVAPGGESGLSEALLDMIGLVTRVAVLLSEASPEEAQLVQCRVRMLQGLVADLPKPKPRAAIGFVARKRAKR